MRTVRLALISAVMCVMHTTAVAAAEPVPTKPSADDQKIICRKTLETGSLVKKNKQCFTKAEWDKIYAAHRDGNTKLFDGLSTRCGQDGGAGCTF